MGIGSRNLRTIDHDPAMRMIPSALDAAISTDKHSGQVPVAVIASAGTVNTGVIDPLDEIADVCERHGVWFHVGGAYGARRRTFIPFGSLRGKVKASPLAMRVLSLPCAISVEGQASRFIHTYSVIRSHKACSKPLATLRSRKRFSGIHI